MAIPSKQMFDIYLNLNWKTPENLLDHIGSLRRPSKEDISNCCEQLDISIQDHRKFFLNTEVTHWFNSQENYKKAIKALSFKNLINPAAQYDLTEYKESRNEKLKEKFDKAEWLSVERSDQYLIDQANRINKGKAQRYFLNFYKPTKPELVTFGIAKALYDYLYTDRAKDLITLKESSINLLNDTKKNLNEFSKLSILDEFVSNPAKGDWPVFGRGYFNIHRIASRFNDLNINIPFERNDKTLKERVLIYDLNKTFRHYFRTSKSNAIFFLLMLEGIKNNIEKRNIEKMLSKWNRH